MLSRWWKHISLFTLISTAIVAAILFLLPKQYLSEATALRASSYTTDKASIFNRNIEMLYSTLGSADDLDMIIGTAQLDTVYLVQADAFGLASHYRIRGDAGTARRKAAAKLKKKTRVMKSGYGELKVQVWDRDKNLAASIANGIMDQLQSIHQQLLNESNIATLEGLNMRKMKLLSALDTLGPEATARHTALMNQLQQYEELIGQYELMVDTKQPALLVVEHARPALRYSRPRILLNLGATIFLSLLFGTFTALVWERKKRIQL